MNDLWKMHWLEASGDIEHYKPAIVRAARIACEQLSSTMRVPRLDMLIQCMPEAAIPEFGFSGRAYNRTLFCLNLDPENPNLIQMLENGTLVRQILHEVHHCLRMRGPGYGWTLGEAMVSEGLAGQFVSWLLNTAAEPWERAIALNELLANPVALTTLQSPHYDHSAWFYGTGDYRRWYGYTLGYQMVAVWLRDNAECSAEKWINVTADEVITAGLANGLVKK
ncbi:DUF2268 domain-containing putative Zn-dependent protease [Candidatus Pantoea rara]|uniref:DUF2268 domain-containing putative Zn-dependent protease n=1 Tax=Candidatus Pantoea rara TaxID=1947037 RepID=UPI003EBC0087